MSFAEVILRVGVSFVAWMLIYMHLLMLMVTRLARCPGGDTGPWKLTLLTAVMAAASALVVRYGRGIPGMAAVLRYFALPLLALLPLALWTVLPYLTGTTLGTLGLCEVRVGSAAPETIPGWHRGWAPLQLVVLTLVPVFGWLAWRDGSGQAR